MLGRQIKHIKKVHPIFGVMQTGFYPSNVKTKTFKTPYIFSEPTACFKFSQSLKESKLSTALS